MTAKVKDMTTGKPFGIIFMFALPLMAGNIFQQLYTVMDTMIVGQKLGVSGLASLGAADWTNWMMLGVATGFSQGFSIPVAQKFGAGDYKSMRKIIGTMIILGAVISVLSAAAGEIALPSILRILNTPDDVMGGAMSYLRVTFAAVPIVMTYNIMASILRALGNSRAPLLAMVVAAVINISLDLLFVMVFDWGIVGAAAATVIAQVCSCVYCFLVLRQISILKLERDDWEIDLHRCTQMLKLGFPIALQNVVIAVGGMVVQSVVNGYGYIFIAGFTATSKLYGVLEVAAISYGFSMTTYAGQNLGAGNITRIKEGMRAAVILGVITSVIITAGMLLFGNILTGMFISGTEQEVEQAMKTAYHFLLVLSCPLSILYLLHIYRSALMGLGDTIIPMISGFAEFLFRVGCAFLLPALIGEWGIYFAETAAWVSAAVILVAAYYVRIGKLQNAMSQ